MNFTTTMHRVNRIVVDPNGVSRINPEWSAALIEEATFIPAVGDRVLAVQPDEEGPDYVGSATVKLVDATHGIIYLDVDWDTFVDDVPERASGLIQVQHATGFDVRSKRAARGIAGARASYLV